MSWNKIQLDADAITQRFIAGETALAIGRSLGVTDVVIYRHLREYVGGRYDTIVATHWHARASQRVIERAGSRTKGGARWFTPDEEAQVIAAYRANPTSYEVLAATQGCSRVVIKRLIKRSIPIDERKHLLSLMCTGRRFVEYPVLTCPVCGSEFELPPWKQRQGQVFCSRQCKGVATRGEKSWAFGKTNHAIGAWYEVNDRRFWLRSQWEYGVALYLDRQGIVWEYEPTSFPLQITTGPTSYTPDFYLPSTDIYIEVKGYWRPVYREKQAAFRSAYPQITIELWDKPVLIAHGIITRKGRLIV